MAKKNNDETEQLVQTIVKGIEDKKGEKIIRIDFTGMQNAVCKFFIICHAASNKQVKTIADSVEMKVKKDLNERVWCAEGMENAQWIILDYASVVVHIFQTEYRSFYDLENLWADAKIVSAEKDASVSAKKTKKRTYSPRSKSVKNRIKK